MCDVCVCVCVCAYVCECACAHVGDGWWFAVKDKGVKVCRVSVI